MNTFGNVLEKGMASPADVTQSIGFFLSHTHNPWRFDWRRGWKDEEKSPVTEASVFDDLEKCTDDGSKDSRDQWLVLHWDKINHSNTSPSSDSTPQLLSAHSDTGPNVLHDVMRCNFSQHILTQDPTYFMMSCGATSLSTFWQDPTSFMMSCGATSLSTFWHRTQRPSWCHAVQLLSAHSDTGPNLLHDVMRATSLSTFCTVPNVLHDVMRCNFSQHILTQDPSHNASHNLVLPVYLNKCTLLCFSLGYTDNFIQGYSWMEQLLR